MVERKDVKVRTSYENSLNQYDEVQQKIKGVFSPLSGTMSFICTRLIKWRIIRKRNKKEVDIKKREKRATWVVLYQ